MSTEPTNRPSLRNARLVFSLSCLQAHTSRPAFVLNLRPWSCCRNTPLKLLLLFIVLMNAALLRADGPPFTGATSYRYKTVYSTFGEHQGGPLDNYNYGSLYDPAGGNDPVQGVLRSSVAVASQSFVILQPGGVAVDQYDAIRIPVMPPFTGYYDISVSVDVEGQAFSAGGDVFLPGQSDGTFVIWAGAQVVEGDSRIGWGDSESLCQTEFGSMWWTIGEGVLEALLACFGFNVGGVMDLLSVLSTLQEVADPVCETSPVASIVLKPGGAFLEAGHDYSVELLTHAYGSSLSVASLGLAKHVGISDYQLQVTEVELIATSGGGGSNQVPVLSDPCVMPGSGTLATQFEFSVYYFDADEDPPEYAAVYITGGHGGLMTLASGAPADGKYHFQTSLPVGSYMYSFCFMDSGGSPVWSDWCSGPYVVSDEDATIEIIVQCTVISADISLEYSLTGYQGPWTTIPISGPTPEPLPVPAGSTVWFRADTESVNHEFREWVLIRQGEQIGGDTDNLWGVTLQPGWDQVALEVLYGYTPHAYTISGDVLSADGAIVPGGVGLVLSSPVQQLYAHSSDGTFTFDGVSGGVSVTVTPSASGYAFVPPLITYGNLVEDDTDVSFIAEAADDSAPMTTVIQGPPRISESSSAVFSWLGYDNTTPSVQLVYQSKLEGVDADWSPWSANTTRSYEAPNGSYRFWVRAKDQAGNLNQAPEPYDFVVNAAPRVVSAVPVCRSVWASRITLDNPSQQPASQFVLLPQHAGVASEELVPVELHRPDAATAVGANEIVAGVLGLAERLTKVRGGWLVMLPEPLAAGATTAYDVTWGRIVYWGWKEEVSVPPKFPNLDQEEGFSHWGYLRSAYLSPLEDVWYCATRWRSLGGDACNTKTWAFLNIRNLGGDVLPEWLIRYEPGNCTATPPFGVMFNGAQCAAGEGRIFLFYDDDMDTNGPSYSRYAVQVYDVDGSLLSQRTSEYHGYRLYRYPRCSIDGRLWVLSKTAQPPVAELRAEVLNNDGMVDTPEFVIDSLEYAGAAMTVKPALPIGGGLVVLWERAWRTQLGRERREIVYQARSADGALIQPTTVLTVILPDGVDVDDEWQVDYCVTDRDGKLWFSYHRIQTGVPTSFYCAVIGSDGQVWQEPTETDSMWQLRFADRDGYVWLRESNQLTLLRTDGSVAIGPRTPCFIPNQEHSAGAASVVFNEDGSEGGYRLFDRWSPSVIEFNISQDTVPTVMELFDLDLWSNDLHPSDLTVTEGGNVIWSGSGQFTGHVSVDVDGVFGSGSHILTLAQDDLLGGQVLIAFPYMVPDGDGDGVPDPQDNCPDAFNPNQADSDEDGVGDACDACPGFDDHLDCNGNSIPDGCDILWDNSPDCNLNAIPDECDLAAGGQDCNSNGIPDECETASLPVLFVSSRNTDSVLAYYGATGQFLPPPFVGPGVGGLDYPNGIGIDSQGDVYVASVGTDSVIKYSRLTGRPLLTYTGGGLDGPVGIVLREPGSLLVASYHTDSVLEFDLQTGAYQQEFVSAGSGGLDGPGTLLLTPGGNLLVAGENSDNVLEYDGQTGAYVRVAASGGGLDVPTGLAHDPNGNLLVGRYYGGSVLRYAPDGTYVDEFIPPGAGGLAWPEGMAWGPNGHLFVCDRATAGVLEFTDAGAFVRVFAAGGGLDEPTYLVWGTRRYDCNGNGVPDDCDLVDGTSQDCNSNGMPDECDVLDGTSADTNGNGIPDECEMCRGDLNCDGSVNFGDINAFVLYLSNHGVWLQTYANCPPENGDIDSDGVFPSFGDINPFVTLMTSGQGPCP